MSGSNRLQSEAVTLVLIETLWVCMQTCPLPRLLHVLFPCLLKRAQLLPACLPCASGFWQSRRCSRRPPRPECLVHKNLQTCSQGNPSQLPSGHENEVQVLKAVERQNKHTARWSVLRVRSGCKEALAFGAAHARGCLGRSRRAASLPCARNARLGCLQSVQHRPRWLIVLILCCRGFISLKRLARLPPGLCVHSKRSMPQHTAHLTAIYLLAPCRWPNVWCRCYSLPTCRISSDMGFAWIWVHSGCIPFCAGNPHTCCAGGRLGGPSCTQRQTVN